MSDQPEKKQGSYSGDRKPYGDRRPQGGGYAGKGKPYGDKDRKGGYAGKPYRKDDGEKKPYRKDGEKKPYDGSRKSYDGEKKPFDKDRKPYNKDRKPFDGEKRKFDRDGDFKGERKFDRDRKFDGERKFDGDRKPYDKDRRSYDRDGDGERKSFRKFDGEKKPYDRDRKFDGERKFDRDRKYDKDRKQRFESRSDEDGAGKREGYRGDKQQRFGSSKKDQARLGYQGRKSFDASSAVSPARAAALKVVAQLRKRDAFAQDLIDKHIDGSSMKPEDRAFATKLVLGVVSARGTLDDILNRCMNDPSDVKDDVRDALRISAYEIVFLQKGPHAAVDQGVELVRTIAPKASGVANAILRKVVASKDEFPFGDPQREMDAYARQHCFPQWLAEELVAAMGADEAHEFMDICNEPAPVFIALNAAKEGEDVLGTLIAAHDDPKQAEIDGFKIPGCYKLNSGQVLADGRMRRLLNNGHLLVSDAASQAVAHIVLPDEKPASMLEIGAGRATKTILIQSNAMRKWGSQIEEYVTLDNHAFKTKLLTERAEAYGVNVSEALTGDATALDAVLSDRQFDAIFIDAPCTGLGTLRRHPEIRWRLKPETIDEYAELGLAMLKESSKHVNKGGTLAYATCTITSKENVSVVKRFLESAEGAGFKLLPIEGKAAFSSRLTSEGSDAHFAVKMVKLSE